MYSPENLVPLRICFHLRRWWTSYNIYSYFCIFSVIWKNYTVWYAYWQKQPLLYYEPCFSLALSCSLCLSSSLFSPSHLIVASILNYSLPLPLFLLFISPSSHSIHLIPSLPLLFFFCLAFFTFSFPSYLHMCLCGEVRLCATKTGLDLTFTYYDLRGFCHTNWFW